MQIITWSMRVRRRVVAGLAWAAMGREKVYPRLST